MVAQFLSFNLYHLVFRLRKFNLFVLLCNLNKRFRLLSIMCLSTLLQGKLIYLFFKLIKGLLGYSSSGLFFVIFAAAVFRNELVIEKVFSLGSFKRITV